MSYLLSNIERLQDSFVSMTINGRKCSFQTRPINSSSPIDFDFPDHNLFLLHSLHAPTITIKATNLFAFDRITATAGRVKIFASSKIFNIHSSGKHAMSLEEADRKYILSQFAFGLAHRDIDHTFHIMTEVYDAITDPHRCSTDEAPDLDEQAVTAFFDIPRYGTPCYNA